MRIHPTAEVSADAEIAGDVEIGAHVVIEGQVRIGAGTRILPNVFITGWTEIGENCQIHVGVVLGHTPQDLSYRNEETYLRIGNGNIIREYTTIHRGTKAGSATVIGNDSFLMAYSHVAHNCRIGNGVILANASQLGGYVEVGDRTFISSNVVIHQYTRVGRLAMLGGLSAANQDIPPFVTCGGRPCVATGLNAVGLRRAGLSQEARDAIKDAYRILYRSGIPVGEALPRIEAEVKQTDEVREMVDFIKNAKRGIVYHGEGVKGQRRESL